MIFILPFSHLVSITWVGFYTFPAADNMYLRTTPWNDVWVTKNIVMCHYSFFFVKRKSHCGLLTISYFNACWVTIVRWKEKRKARFFQLCHGMMHAIWLCEGSCDSKFVVNVFLASNCFDTFSSSTILNWCMSLSTKFHFPHYFILSLKFQFTVQCPALCVFSALHWFET